MMILTLRYLFAIEHPHFVEGLINHYYHQMFILKFFLKLKHFVERLINHYHQHINLLEIIRM
jgi:hypothetical protein